MKKLINLFLLLLCLAVAFPASATTDYTFLVRCEDISNITVVKATSSDNAITSGDNISISKGFAEYTATASSGFLGIGASDNNYIGIRNSNNQSNSSPAVVYVNGNLVNWTSKQTGTNFTGKKTYYAHVIDLSKYPQPALIEIYNSSSTPTYTYPLTLSVTDPDSQIDSFQNDTKNESVYEDIESGSTTFRYGDSFIVRTSSAATSCTLNGASIDQGGSAGEYTYTFSPTPALTAPTFAIEVHEIATYNVKLQTDDASKITSVTKNGSAVATPTGPITEYSDCNVGDVFVVTTTDDALAAYYNSTTLNRVNGYYTFKVEENMSQTCVLRFSETVTVDPNDKFSITLNVDRDNAVQYRLNDTQITGAPIILSQGNTTIDIPLEGYIEVSVTDKTRYAFTKFEDTNKSKEEEKNFMDYENQQTTPVTIRKTRTTGEQAGFDVDGHTFKIETLDINTLSGYNININIVDDATYVVAKVGASTEPTSANNRTLTLAQGDNNVRILSTDQYLLIQTSNFQRPLYSVSLDGTNVDYDNAVNRLYIIQLSEALAGKTVTITANTPAVVSDTQFSAYIEGFENIEKITYWEGNDQWEQHIITEQFNEGDNTIMFNAGDSYHIIYKQGSVISQCTLDGTSPATSTDGGATFVHNTDVRSFDFIPSDGQEFILKFAAPQAKPKFTIKTDTPDNMSYIYNSTTHEEIFDADSNGTFGNGNGQMEIEFNPGDEMLILFRGEPTITLNGNTYDLSSNVFKPNNGDVLFFKYKEDLSYEQNDHMLVCIHGELYDETYVSLAWKGGSFEVNEGTRADNITFNAEKEGELTLRVFEFPGGTVHAYLNDTELSRKGTGSGSDPFTFTLTGKNNDIIRLYFTKEVVDASAPAPQEVNIIATDAKGSDSNAIDALKNFIFTREDIQPLTLNYYNNKFYELIGTHLKISHKNNAPFTVAVSSLNDESIHDPTPASAPKRVRYVANDAEYDNAENGVVTIEVDQPMNISVAEGVVTGIEAVSAESDDAQDYDVFNLQGIPVLHHATDADLHNLPAGMYIHHGHKVVIK